MRCSPSVSCGVGGGAAASPGTAAGRSSLWSRVLQLLCRYLDFEANLNTGAFLWDVAKWAFGGTTLQAGTPTLGGGNPDNPPAAALARNGHQVGDCLDHSGRYF